MAISKNGFLFKQANPSLRGVKQLRSSNVRSLAECSLLCSRETDCNEFSINLTAFMYLFCVLFNVQPYESKCVVKNKDPGYPKYYTKIWDLQPPCPHIDEINLVGKVCSQSSTFGERICQFANDGIRGHNCESDGCANTDVETSAAWWRVDLGKLQTITKVMLYNRDMRSTRLDSFTIAIQKSLTPGDNVTNTCVENVPYEDNLERVLQCESPVTGRYLVVSIVSPGAVITLTEVRAFGC